MPNTAKIGQIQPPPVQNSQIRENGHILDKRAKCGQNKPNPANIIQVQEK